MADVEANGRAADEIGVPNRSGQWDEVSRAGAEDKSDQCNRAHGFKAFHRLKAKAKEKDLPCAEGPSQFWGAFVYCAV